MCYHSLFHSRQMLILIMRSFHYRHLHSFPTRRSSDLAMEDRCRLAFVALVANQGDRKPLRSEEHTSELQSPCNLVCRLLLGKNKLSILFTCACYYSWSRDVFIRFIINVFFH